MKEDGYEVGEIPEQGDELISKIIERCSNDREFLTEEQMRQTVGRVEIDLYDSWFRTFPEKVRGELEEAWGPPPGHVFYHEGSLVIPGIILGNIFIGVQPPRGFGENPISIYTSCGLR